LISGKPRKARPPHPPTARLNGAQSQLLDSLDGGGGGGGGGNGGEDEAADFEGEDGGGAAAAARYTLGASAASTGEAAAFYAHSRAISHDAREARLATRAKTMSLLLSREFRAR
jgi:hypothetical protein